MIDDAIKVECRGCGSSLAYSAKDQTLLCPYCGTVAEIPRTEEELPDNPSVILPLTVELTGLTDAVHEHRGGVRPQPARPRPAGQRPPARVARPVRARRG